MTLNRAIVVVALTGGGLAAMAGSPYRADHAMVDAAALARAIATEADHVTAIELAQWIRARKPGLRILDVSDADAVMDVAVPQAELVSMADLTTVAATIRPGDPLVVYSAGGAHGGQAWVLLRALGFTDVYFLQGGLDAWISEVLSPTLPPVAGLTDAERRTVESVAELSRYFGGEPREGDVDVPVATERPAATLADRVQAIRRRGC